MYFVISAGGTAGHINPALAVADELRKMGHEILFVGTPNHIESKLACEAGFPFLGLELSGFDKSKPWSLFGAIKKILKASKKMKKLFEEKRPDAVLGFGAYVSIPVGRAANSLNIPLIIHEQNSVPGMANKYLAKHATLLALTYKESKDYFKNMPKETKVIGNPVRASFESSSRERGREKLNIPSDAHMLLVFGGSLGAHHINSVICSMKNELLAIDNLYIIQSSGERDFDFVKTTLDLNDEEQKRWQVFEYIKDMGDVLAASDLVLSRAGASSLAEIMTIGVASILVPYPYARSDHQTLNAKSCVECGAAKLVADSDVDSDEFRALLLDLLSNQSKRDSMAKACKAFSGTDARTNLSSEAVRIGGNK